MSHQSDLMLVLQVVQVLRKTGSSPDELEVLLLFFFTESFKDSPEACNNSVVITAVRERSDCL